jgi:hypothetical protein
MLAASSGQPSTSALGSAARAALISGHAATPSAGHWTLVCLLLFFFTIASTPQAAQTTGVNPISTYNRRSSAVSRRRCSRSMADTARS